MGIYGSMEHNHSDIAPNVVVQLLMVIVTVFEKCYIKSNYG